jgi:hypothetical protein
MFEIIEKVGIDIAPLRVNEEADALWLMACVWPHDEVRRSRLGQAI